MTRRQLTSGSEPFDLAGAVNTLRQLIAKTEAFATTVDDLFEEVHRNDDPRQHERLAWIVTEAATAAQAALTAISKLTAEVAKHRVGT